MFGLILRYGSPRAHDPTISASVIRPSCRISCGLQLARGYVVPHRRRHRLGLASPPPKNWVPTFAAAELFYYAPLLILNGAGNLQTFSPGQLNTLALLSLKMYAYGGALLLVFYGLGSILLGYLIFRSGYLPKLLGILFALSGVGFVVDNFVFVLAPAYASPIFLLPMAITVLSFSVWLLIKGVDLAKWEAKAATTDVSL
jgi:hypothetical protein